MPDPRKSHAHQQLKLLCQLTYPWTCHLCGQAIPRGVHWRHPLAYEPDHLLTVNERPDLALSIDNVRPSHRRCNQARNNKPYTPGLVLELTERFSVRTPDALRIFGDTPM